MKNNLFDCYSRLLIDNHIAECKPEYMRNFSPQEYCRLVKLAQVESAMVYACCHNGNCYYPTRVGHQHRNLEGRDIFGETVALLRENGIVPIAYYTVNYHNDCAKRFPGARLVDNLGRSRDGRYFFTCPNQPEALEFYQEQIREIMNYDVDGIFIDMTFWASVCCCDKCREKFGKIPEKINWSDPEWVKFQRFRERSMAEFAAKLTAAAKAVKPQATVTHQFSPVLHGWYLGQSAQIAEASDYASGDFYGGKLQQRFAVKAFDGFTTQAPYEFMTSRCVTLYDHTSCKSYDELLMSALTTLANGGAYFFIDAIDPDGSLIERFYRELHLLNYELAPFRQAVADRRARLTAETAIYFSISCCVNDDLDGMKLADFGGGSSSNMGMRKNAVMDEVLGTAEILNKMHVPYRVVAELDDLTGIKTLIINNMAYLNADDCDKLRSFVRHGGTLLATGKTSLMDMDGNSDGNFQLADLFGVDWAGGFSDRINYIGSDLVLSDGKAVLVNARPGTCVREYLTFTDFAVRDPDNFASIHSDPPSAVPSGFPGMTENRFGDGRCFYLAAPVLMLRQYTQQQFGRRLFNEIVPQMVKSSVNLPQSLELTLLKSEKSDEYILCLVNYQDELPAIPLYNVELSISIPRAVRSVIRVRDGSEMPFETDRDVLTLKIPEIGSGEFYILK